MTESAAIARLDASVPLLRAWTARVDEVRALQLERVRRPNPAVIYAREHAGDAGDVFLSARQELSISGRRSLLRSAGALAVDAAEAEARSQRTQLVSDLRIAFTDLLLAQRRQEAVRDAIAALDGLIKVLRAREAEGEGSTFDRMRGERALVDLDATLAAAEAERASARGRLAPFLGGTGGAAIAVEGELNDQPATPPVDSLIGAALASRPDYRAASLLRQQHEAEQKAAARLAVPTPTVGGGLKRSSTDVRSASGYHFSIDVAVPLFDRGEAAAALASAQTARADAELSWLRTRIESDVRAAHAVLTIMRRRAERFRDAVGVTAQPLTEVARVGYEEGELGILELLDAERQALDARLQMLEFAAAARRAAIELDRAIAREITP